MGTRRGQFGKIFVGNFVGSFVEASTTRGGRGAKDGSTLPNLSLPLDELTRLDKASDKVSDKGTAMRTPVAAIAA
jgi:hypothetical protein